MAYLGNLPLSSVPVSLQVRERMVQLGKPVIDKQALQRLDELEREHAADLSVAAFKFATNEEMLHVLNLV